MAEQMRVLVVGPVDLTSEIELFASLLGQRRDSDSEADILSHAGQDGLQDVAQTFQPTHIIAFHQPGSRYDLTTWTGVPPGPVVIGLITDPAHFVQLDQAVPRDELRPMTWYPWDAAGEMRECVVAGILHSFRSLAPAIKMAEFGQLALTHPGK